jgi:hypothetical protein
MLLEVDSAKYIGEYKLHVKFNTGEEGDIDLKDTIFQDKREIFKELRDIEYFKNFHLILNTIGWPNQLDLAPEYLRDTIVKQKGLLKQSTAQS